jgi:hypothetical protein
MTMARSLLVQRIRYLLGDNPWETLGEASSDTSEVFVGSGEDWAQGDIGEFLEDGDTFYTRASSGSDIVATRGYYGTTPAPHNAGSRILKNPKYRYWEITNAITSVINFELPFPRIYKVGNDTITPSQTTTWYDLNEDALGLVNVEQLGDNAPIPLRKYGEFHKFQRVRFERNLPASLCASGVGLAFPDGFLDNDNTVYVTFASKITDAVSFGVYQDFDAGDAVVEAIALGAVALLQSALELRKPRKGAQETDNLRSGSYFGQLYKKALWTAEKEIRARYPLMAF